MTLTQYVEKTNAAFVAASPEEKRVMIAKDVIKRLDAKNLIAKQGEVVELITNPPLSTNYFNEPFQQIINNKETSCKVCGKGAMLCAYIGRVNKFSFGDTKKWDNGYYHDKISHRDTFDKVHPKLEEIFTIQQIDLIETAFEGGSYLGTLGGELEDKAIEFYEKYSNRDGDGVVDTDKLLRKICKNIIKNSGIFIP